jgi:hypothetical protein
MNKPFEVIKYKDCAIKLYPDDSAESPRDGCNVGEILYTSTRYNLGDRRAESEEIREITLRDDVVWLPVYAYIHSGTRLNTTGFSCPWDSGQCGIIWCTKERAVREWGNKSYTKKVESAARKQLDGEVETLDAYYSGAVAGFIATDPDGEEIDSCWGFYPDGKGDYSHVIEEAKAEIDAYCRNRAQQAEQHQAQIGA